MKSWKSAVNGVVFGDRPVHPRVAEHLAPGAHPGLAALVVASSVRSSGASCRVEVAEQRAGHLRAAAPGSPGGRRG